MESDTFVELTRKESEVRYRRLFEAAQDGILILDAETGAITDVNPYLVKMLGFSRDEFVGKKLWEVGAFRDIKASQEAFEALQENEYIRYDDLPLKTKSGKLIQVEFVSNVYMVDKEKVIQCNIRDITERKHSEKALQESEERYRLLIETLPDGVVVHNEGRVVFANPASAAIFGESRPDALIGKSMIEFVHPKYRKCVLKRIRLSLENGSPEPLMEEIFVRQDGTPIDVGVSAIPFLFAGKPAMLTVFNDIGERKQAQKDLRESEKRFRALIENNVDAITLLDAQGVTIYDSPAAPSMLGYGMDDWIGRNAFALIHPEDSSRVQALYQNLVLTPGLRVDCTFRVQHKSGFWIWIDMVATNMLAELAVKAIVLNYRDITGRKLDEEKIQRQLDHLTALSSIDRAITANFDIKLTLSEILLHVTKELRVDAADIQLLDTKLNLLEFAADRGFRSAAVKKTQLHLGDSYAGRAVRERKLIHIPDLGIEPDSKLLSGITADDNFICYFGIPLINKGQVKGVLEVFHRTALKPDSEWYEFLNALAGQAAIAIENASLFEGLQRSNVDLIQAYDATIEGWSHALDLRDKETEGHTQRALEMTTKLARALGVSEADLVQVRWGVLLHDIGKMGVPDGILLKPGPLTEDEWVVMKKHPTLAYEMLSPIRYLRSALDIPHYHHEKWDGSGYPFGLKGIQIPLLARIFALVDVWDALGSDRPYRAAWTEEKVREFILASSGTHFDPKVVDIFMQLPY